MSEWIKHHGKFQSTVLTVTVRRRDGSTETGPADLLRGWEHTFQSEDIMEYRIETQERGVSYEDKTKHASLSLETILTERGSRYGKFIDHARIVQNIKRAMADSPNWAKLADDQKEALEMLAHKVGRILNGDPDYHDSWQDIVGYTQLVANRLGGVK